MAAAPDGYHISPCTGHAIAAIPVRAHQSVCHVYDRPCNNDWFRKHHGCLNNKQKMINIKNDATVINKISKISKSITCIVNCFDLFVNKP